MDLSRFSDLHRKFAELPIGQKLFVSITVGYLTVKLIKKLRIISKYTNQYHELPSTSNIVDPKRHLFPNYFKNKNGLWIFHRDWLLPKDTSSQKTKGVVIICHGGAEHIQRYEHLAKFFRQNGYAVYGIDHQGHGMSDGDSGHVEQFEDFVNDLLLFSQRIADEYPNCKRFILGHSMGGLVALHCASRNPSLYNGGVILSSPYLGPGPKLPFNPNNPIIESLFRFLSNYLPKLPLIKLDNAQL